MIMAGMLPGVECARRRRFQNGGSVDSLTSCSRRSAFPLCTTGLDMHPSSSISMMQSHQQRSIMNKEIHEEALGHTAREARERLDARLRIKRHNSLGCMKLGKSEGCSHGRLHRILGSVQRQVFSSKKSTRKFSWSKLRWTASEEQADCAVCLEDFQEGDMLVHLPCAHRFHWNCVLPWLESSSHCPCCRMTIFLG